MIGAIAATSLLARLAFYTWWNPFEPFLFSVMSIPFWWLLWMWIAIDSRATRFPDIAIPFAALMLWVHNYFHLVDPFRNL